MRLSGNSPVMIGMLYTGHSGYEVDSVSPRVNFKQGA